MKAKLKIVEAPVTKLDIGCGKNKKEGFHGVDQYKMDGVDTVCNLSGDFSQNFLKCIGF